MRCGGIGEQMTDELEGICVLNPAFDKWWHPNHPLDWFSKINGGEPVNHTIRLHVWDLAKRAFEAGQASPIGDDK